MYQNFNIIWTYASEEKVVVKTRHVQRATTGEKLS